MTVTEVDAGPKKVSRTAVICASAQELYAMVADPHRHGELDGSGTVKDTVSGPDRLTKDAKFSVKMKQYGVPYRITSRVTELEPDRVVEWRHPVGHRWRWEFEAQGDRSTKVTETWDASRINGVLFAAFKAGSVLKRNGEGITATLQNLQQKYAT
jgi:Polyketide cyclase / dehydrase and lipid transport